MAELLDFQIDTMKFRLAVDNTAYSSTNTGRPYRRSTAPFRRDQIDTSGSPGDNSLTGWWTESQFSFHKGAGIEFYEVSDAATLNRFDTSLGVDVRTPGKCFALYPTYDATTSAFTSIDDMAFAGNRYAAVVDNGILKEWDANVRTLTALTLAGGGNALRVTASDNAYFVTTSANKVERLSHDGSQNAVLYSYTGGLAGVWYAKDRLWIVATDGSVFTESVNPTGTLPIALTGPVATVVDLASHQTTEMVYSNNLTTLTEAPTGVYLARGGQNVYQISLASDGSVPTLTEGVVACTLPTGEAVMCLQYYLGQMVMITSRGVRIALVNDGSGAVTYGPILISHAHSSLASGPRRIGCHNSTVFVPLDVVYAIDLGNPVDPSYPLQYSYSQWSDLPGGSGAVRFTGTVLDPQSGKVYWFGGYYFRSINDGRGGVSTYVASGARLDTAYHRFGTLDEKSFHSVSVKVDGFDGSINVSQIDESGTVTLLGSIAYSDRSKEFPFSTTGGAERMALRFEFQGTHAPTLLGYQIKVLPLPKRQRLIEVPLLMRDVFKTRTGREMGRAGNGWDQLQALEALESSKAIVPYTDFRTGETGTAYIDGVEFYGDNLTSPGDRSFGGIAYVALRVIS